MRNAHESTKIRNVTHATGCTDDMAAQALESCEWHQAQAIELLCADCTPVSFIRCDAEPGEFLVITTTKHVHRAYISEGVFKTAREVRRYVREETQWESCQRVQCPALGIDARGFFA